MSNTIVITKFCAWVKIVPFHVYCYRGVYYSGTQLFNILLASVTAFKNDKRRFRLVLRKYLQDNSFYSVEEFVEHAKGLKG
jgi:hypothetical protein